jgi:hypothetical protein
MSYRYAIDVLQGLTSRDHLLPEIARAAACGTRTYASRWGAKRAGYRAIARVLENGGELYRFDALGGFRVRAE